MSINEEQFQNNDIPKSAGKLLQAERLLQQLTCSDVANKLRLSEQYIIDIEADNYAHIGARTYARGYILSYAKLLNINTNEIMQSMQFSPLPEENLLVQHILEKERDKPVINISLRPRGYYRRYFSNIVNHNKKMILGGGVAILVAIIGLWWHHDRANKPTSVVMEKPVKQEVSETAQAQAPDVGSMVPLPDNAAPVAPLKTPDQAQIPAAVTPPPTPAPHTTTILHHNTYRRATSNNAPNSPGLPLPGAT